VSPNPVTAAAAWTTAAVVDVVAVVVAAALLAWDRWCPDGVALCPTEAQRPARDALWLAVLAGVLAVVALVALVRGRLLLAAVQVALVVALAVVAARLLPAAWAHLRERQFGWTAAAIVATTSFGPHSSTYSVLRVCETEPTRSPRGL
jgi:hypothetical protein